MSALSSISLQLFQPNTSAYTYFQHPVDTNGFKSPQHDSLSPLEFTRALAQQLVTKTFNAAGLIHTTSPLLRGRESSQCKVGPSGYRFLPKSTQAGNSVKEEMLRKKQEEMRRMAARLGPEFVYELHDRDQKRAQVAVQILKFSL
jgi:hypothetical protein